MYHVTRAPVSETLIVKLFLSASFDGDVTNMHRSRWIQQLSVRAPAAHRFNVSYSPVRNASTTTSQNTSAQTSRWPRRLVYAALFGTLGVGAGQWMDTKIAAPPEPGSIEDQLQLQDIHRAFDIGLPIVQQLRANPDYVELEVYENFSEEQKARRLTSGPMAGSRGFGLQKVFWSGKERKLVSVVFMGSGLEGWPTMVHGGALGTVIDENLGRAAIRHFPAQTGVTANLNINYRAPVYSDNFYSLHTTLDEQRSTDRKAYAICEVRDMTGRLCVEAAGLFVVPKNLQLSKVGEHF
ncbi:hypothetical protein N7462_001088 [Penicillium macrosclerotiorum]|uniref:uncharacterized protein n=1 Tax=Penicillium macrosclerotiorum TaxID=303699 RepID=UPI0025493AB1|nr:uncharacterized protein N7462_001088 [Penicillium macrosclerotiorum]KAJ5699083.1 hypothetical protein N7462_001088 [Penicillium macrosclerotiorum]